jgi:phenylalanyl-tRNA synthetase beta chain
MRAPLSWLREYVDVPADLTTSDLAHRLTMLGLKLEALEAPGVDVSGPLVVGRVVSYTEEPQKNGKVIRWCRVDVGPEHNDADGGRGIVCGAHNFAEGDLVVVSLPGSVLPGPFPISARKTYGHVSDGMICSTRELGTGDDHDGILVLDPRVDGDAKPGDDAIALLHLRDEVIEFEVNPDRAYALSLRGIAREVALALDVPFRDPADRDVPAANDRGWPVRVEAADGCPVFATRTVTGFDPTAPSPRWLARRVQLAGMRPISLAVDVTNYVMLELGQPIHGYDGDRLRGPIVVRRAASGERLTTLDGAVRELDPEDLLITDDRGAIGLAGVMGGQETELGDATGHIVIEAAHFDPVSIFRTARRHKLPSEASKRFERGVDPLLPASAADRVAGLLVRYGGGLVTDGVTYVGRPPAGREIALDPTLPGRISGVQIPTEAVPGHLRAVGCVVAERAEGHLAVAPPSWRPDLTDPYDLVEEVVRVVGYDQVPSVLPAAPPGLGLTRGQRLRRRSGRVLAGQGLLEVLTYPFVGERDWDALGLDATDIRRDAVRIANPLSDEEPLLRTTLLPGLLRALARNVGRGTADVALFEHAPVYLPTPAGGTAPILPVDRRPTEEEWADLVGAVPDQPLHLAVALTGQREPSGWWGSGRQAAWADAVQAVRLLASELGVDLAVRAAARTPWHPGRCAALLVDGVVVGHAGELHPRVCQAYGVPTRTVAAEVDLDRVIAAAVPVVPAPRFSSYPVAKEDVALIVERDVSAAAVAGTLREGAGPLLESVRLFDLYTGEQVGEGKKSLAFALRFRAPDRTLTDAELAEARDSAVALAVQRHGAVHRA